MNTSKSFWVRLRENIGAIIFFSIFQIWISMLFPGHSFLGTTTNAILKPIFSIIGMTCLIWLVISDKMKSKFMVTIAPELDEPQRSWIKNMVLMVMAFAASSIIFFMYRTGFFNYSKLYYIVCGMYGFFLYYFLYLSTGKGKKN